MKKLILFINVALFFCLAGCTKEEYTTLSVSPFEKSVTAAGETFQVWIKANKKWEATPSADWLTVSPASGEGNATINVTTAATTSTTDDVAEVVVTSGTVSLKLTVTRKGKSTL